MIRFLSLLLLLCLPVLALAEDPYEQAPIHYSSTKPKDAVQALERLMRLGKVRIDRSDGWSVLRGVLEKLKVPVESQVLVFSKTSKQNDRISPQTPRAVYFNDNAYVGYSLGGSIEVAAIDPLLGPVFYLLDPHEDEKRPLHFERDQSCLSCHGGSFTREVPGVLVRSVFPAATGHPILSQGSTVVDTTTPFSDRWGGWYVTGKHGDSVHRGNVTAVEQPNDTCEMPVEEGANITDLTAFVDVSDYPRQQSDIVALMVLEHQTSVQNVLTRSNHAALRAMHMQRSLQTELRETVTEEPVGTARRIIDHCAEDVVDALLFREEAALPDGGIEGDEAFQTAFVKDAPRSADGRSLKDFQLLTRLFKHRCSYMIHSLTFQYLTPPLKQTVLARLKE
ncbi:MAG TPA: hypothetical protein VD994_05205, partial [Prosthecobacter sp.]|nr:hypothetical protein [Prosthecobacter sp.]